MDHYRSFRDFYPDYLAEHRNPVSKGPFLRHSAGAGDLGVRHRHGPVAIRFTISPETS